LDGQLQARASAQDAHRESGKGTERVKPDHLGTFTDSGRPVAECWGYFVQTASGYDVDVHTGTEPDAPLIGRFSVSMLVAQLPDGVRWA
jgi:hypothetical protein